MVTLQLVHPVLGVVRSRTFYTQAIKDESISVKKVVKKWKWTYGKKYYECSLKWED